jgi:hypothetical protein
MLGMTVQDLHQISHDEFLCWLEYFERRPYGWREDLRTAYIMRAFGVKEKSENIFPSVKAVMDDCNKERAISSTLKGSSIFLKMLGAKNGEKLGVLNEL